MQTELSINALAEYNADTSSIIFSWTTTIENGTFYILSSDDNTEYNVLASTKDTCNYEYEMDYEFDVKYFKVRQVTADKRIAFSEVLCVQKNGDTYVSNFLDTDGDGIPDFTEELYGTDVLKMDTDDDGLNDYQEIYITATNATVYDSICKGVSDAEADMDQDGLSNIYEITIGTSPVMNDTDEDKVSDGDEVNIYKTNPLLYDTDEDGISDGDELAVGLDPLNKYTYDGIFDPEYTFEISLSDSSPVFDEINIEGSPFSMSVDIKAGGNVLENLIVKESDYSSSISNEAVVGVCTQLSYDEIYTVDEVVITYEIDEEIIETNNETDKESEFYGIKRFNIFKYFEEDNILLPVITVVDEKNNAISASVDSLGTYCVVDMGVFLNQIETQWDELENIEEVEESVAEEAIETETYLADGLKMTNLSIAFNSETEAEVHTNTSKTFDLFFIVDTRAVYANEQFNAIKDNIESICETVFLTSKGVNVYIVEYSMIGRAKKYYMNANAQGEYASSNIENARHAIDKLNVPLYSSVVENIDFSAAFEAIKDNTNYNKETYCFCIFDNQAVFYNDLNAYDILDELSANGVNISLVSNVSSSEDYKYGYGVATYTMTDGIFITDYTDFSDEAIAHIYGGVPVIDDESYIITSSGLKTAKLDKKVNEIYDEYLLELNAPLNEKSNGLYDSEDECEYTDTDNDGVYDFAEIDFSSKLLYYKNEKFELPTYEDCINAYGNEFFYVDGGLDRYYEKCEENDIDKSDALRLLRKTTVLPIKSDPMSADSDVDGFVDYYEIMYHEDESDKGEIYYLNPLKFNEWEAHNDMARFTRIAGFSYDPAQKILYSNLNGPQRFFGFCETIDVSADPILSSSIFCDPIYFYYNGREYLLELWKGQYGIMSGVEVGLYYRNPCMISKTVTLSERILELKKFVEEGRDLIDDSFSELDLILLGIKEDSFLCGFLDTFGINPRDFADTVLNYSYAITLIVENLGVDTSYPITAYDNTVEKWYRSADDNNLIDVSFHAKTDENKDNSTDIVEFSRDDTHWWITGFEWGKYTNEEKFLDVDIIITFKDEAMRDAFITGGIFPDELYENENKKSMEEIQKFGLDSVYNNIDHESDGQYSLITKTTEAGTLYSVKIPYGNYLINEQPQTTEDKKLIQGNNEALINVYDYAKEEAGIPYKYNSEDKIKKLLYTNDPNLITVENIYNGFIYTNFFSSDGYIEWLIHSATVGTIGMRANGSFIKSLLMRMLEGNVNYVYGYDVFANYLSPLLSDIEYFFDNGFNITLDYFIDEPYRLAEELCRGELSIEAYKNEMNDWCKNSVHRGISNVANQRYMDKRGYVGYLYQFYDVWYKEYTKRYSIDTYVSGDQQTHYAFNHIFALMMNAKFITENLRELTFIAN